MLAANVVLALWSGCAESGLENELEANTGVVLEAGPPVPAADAGSTVGGSSIGASPPPASYPDAASGPRAPDSGAEGSGSEPGWDGNVPSRDAGSGAAGELDDLLGDLFGDGASGDAGFIAPAPTTGDWKLDDGSFADCPAEPPPIPIIGGPCLGVYFTCGWTHESGAAYACICDWLHWLCL